MDSAQQVSLRWNSYCSHVTGAFNSLRTDEDLVDVTLSCEGKNLRAHKMLLSACSTYFKDLFKENPCQHPVIIFRDFRYEDLEALVTFMYQGEVNVSQEHLLSFLNTAELLAVRGLADGPSRENGKHKASEHNIDNDGCDLITESNESSFANNLAESTERVVFSPSSSTGSSVLSAVSNNKLNPGSPAAKKRKCLVSSTVKMNGNRDRRISNDNEISEVATNGTKVKIEQTDYDEDEQIGLNNELYYRDRSKSADCLPDDVASSVKVEKKDDNLDSVNKKIQLHGSSPIDLNHVIGISGQIIDALPQQPLQGLFGASKPMSNEERPFSCSVCGLRYKYKTNLLAHKKSHTGETKCPICLKILSTRRRLQDHFRMIHGLELVS